MARHGYSFKQPELHTFDADPAVTGEDAEHDHDHDEHQHHRGLKSGHDVRIIHSPTWDIDAAAAKPEGKGGGGGGGKGKGGTTDGTSDGTSGSAPTDISLTSYSVDENSGGGTIVGTLSADDSDKREKFTYRLVDDAEGKFYVEGSKLKVSSGADLDYETDVEHTISVEVTDKGGNTYVETMVISVLDMDETSDPEPPPEPPADDPVDVAEIPYYVDAIIGSDSQRWNYGEAVGTATTVTFSFLTELPSYYGATASEANGFSAFNTQQMNATRDMLSDISSFANIDFVEVSGVGDLTYANANLGSGYGAWAYLPSPYSDRGGDVWINKYYSYNLKPVEGNYAYLTTLHETGHAIGLTHPGDYDVSGGSGTLYLPASEDNRQYTVMSYDKHTSMGNSEAHTMMLYDVAALQHLYGANMTHALGDDIYDFSDANKVIETIWDAGGFDTLSVATSAYASTIDLRDGAFSSLGHRGTNPASDNIAIAFDVTIEAAIGGLANDTLIGNDADNVLTGGLGIDTFVFLSGWGSDVITDFEDGVDLIDLSGAGASFADLQISSTAGGAALAFGGETISLAGIDAALVDETDFIGGLV